MGDDKASRGVRLSGGAATCFGLGLGCMALRVSYFASAFSMSLTVACIVAR